MFAYIVTCIGSPDTHRKMFDSGDHCEYQEPDGVYCDGKATVQ